MDIKTTLKASVAATALFAFAAPVATTANAADDTFATGNKNSLAMSGNISRALYWADDGPNGGIFNSSGGSLNSRIRWVASGTVNESVTAGATYEIKFPQSNSDANSKFDAQGDESQTDTTTWANRHAYVWVNHKTMGKLSIGKTSEPTDGGWRTNTQKHGGTGSNYSQEAFGGAFTFMLGGSNTAISVGDSRSDQSPGGKLDLIRYDLPALPGGLTAGVAWNEAGAGTINVKYAGKVGGLTTSAGIAYKELSSSTSTDDFGLAGSVGIGHSSGLYASLGVGKQEIHTLTATAGNESHVGMHIGYTANIFGAGATGINFGMGESKNANARGQVGASYGITVAQYIDSVGASMTLVYRNHAYENERLSHTGVSDVDLLGIHTVFNF